MNDDALIGMLGWGYNSSQMGRFIFSQFGRRGTFSSVGGTLVSCPALSNHWAFNSARNYSQWGSPRDPYDHMEIW